MKLDFIVLGYAECRVRAAHTACFFNLCREQGFVYTPLSARQRRRAQTQDETEQDAFYCRCRLSLCRRLLLACAQRGIDIQMVRQGGCPVFFYRYHRRAGLLIGGILAAILIGVSGQVVWDVRIEGNEQVSIPELREQLSACGLSVGTWIPSLETDTVESRLLIESDKIAWVSVNMRGTVAYVQIRELMMPKRAWTDEPTNLVARCDGVIESVKLLSGQVMVMPGDVVRRGELLVAGVRDSSAVGYHVASAQGEVLARTENTLVIRVERMTEQKVYVGQKNAEKTLFFFGKSIKVSKSTGIMTDNCDTIKKLEIFSLPGGAALPVSLETTVVRQYELHDVSLSDEQLRVRAYEQLGRALTLATEGATLISKQVECEISDDCILLTCRYRCVENIAESLPIYTDADGTS